MHGMENPFSRDQLQERLEDILGLILSEQRSVNPAVKALNRCSRPQQEHALELARMLARNNLEVAYQFVDALPQAMVLLDENGVEEWATAAVNLYDTQGVKIAIAHMQAVNEYATHYRTYQRGLALNEVQGVLQAFITGLDGRHLQIVSHDSEGCYTDTENVFLPEVLHNAGNRDRHFLLYKAMVAHLWAQTWFGTWRHDVLEFAMQYDAPDQIILLFHHLERLRLDACLKRALPGLHRDIGQLLNAMGETWIPAGWEAPAAALSTATATVDDSYHWLEQVAHWPVPPPVCYQGLLYPQAVTKAMQARTVREKQALQTGLQEMLRQRQPNKETRAPQDTPRFGIQQPTMPTQTQRLAPILTIDGDTVLPPDNLRKVLTSIVQDFGTVPEAYLLVTAQGGGELAAQSHEPEETALQPDVVLYPEWDYRRHRYYKNWCVLREVEVPPQPDRFVQETLHKYRSLLKTLRRTFEALRGGTQWLKRQPFGDDIDVDALIAAYADSCNGLEMSEQVFTKLHRVSRNIAVMLMVDMSGSTKGWINLAERESLVLLCEVFEMLGDRYAIYGFSGSTRKKCEIYPIKRFTETYNSAVRQRISGMSPQAYTRMGVTIRHLTTLLKGVDAHTKLLITLSDGKPDDEGDNYRGTYGIEDTRQALLEAKREGIHPFCITIDTEARTYLPRLYGTVNYVVIDKVSQLPLKISEVYRKLTS